MHCDTRVIRRPLLSGAHDAETPLQKILALGKAVGRSGNFLAGKTKGTRRGGSLVVKIRQGELLVGGLPSLLAGPLVGMALQQFEAVFVLGRLEAMSLRGEALAGHCCQRDAGQKKRHRRGQKYFLKHKVTPVREDVTYAAE